jgi:hypothetical protein
LKKLTSKNRRINVLNTIKQRKSGNSAKTKIAASLRYIPSNWRQVNHWIDEKIQSGLNISISKNNRLTINLPEKMDFSNNYEESVIYIKAMGQANCSTIVGVGFF